MPRKKKPEPPVYCAWRIELYDPLDTMIAFRVVGIATSARAAMTDAEIWSNRERKSRKQPPVEARSAELLGIVRFGPVEAIDI